MRMAAENDFDVAEFEAELFNAGAYERNRFFIVGIDQDVSLRRGDQITPKILRADEIHVPDNLMRRKRLVSVDPLLSQTRQEQQQRQSRESGQSTDAPADTNRFHRPSAYLSNCLGQAGHE